MWAVVMGVIAMLAAAASADAATRSPSQVRFIKNADSSFDHELRNASRSDKTWIRSHYWRMIGFAPFFTRNAVRWAPPTWLYKDAYAIYNDQKRVAGRPNRRTASKHPGWVLRDKGSHRLYIPFGCWGNGCPAYAADLGNRGFRGHWRRSARRHYKKGYRGLYIDDVNMEWRVSNGRGQHVRPFDRRTKRLMKLGGWRSRMVKHTVRIDRKFRRAEVVHNALWFATKGKKVRRQVRSADFIHLERGFSDAGIRGGTGKFGYVTFLRYIRWVHRQKASIVLRPRKIDRTGAMYELANYFLVKQRRDAIVSDWRSERGEWWTGWEADLGKPLGGWFHWRGLFRRNYGKGMVLVNQPDRPTKTVSLSHSYRRMDGSRTSSVTLGAKRGEILFR